MQDQEPFGSASVSGVGSHRIGDAFNRLGTGSVVLGLEEGSWHSGCAWSPAIDKGHMLTIGATRSGKGVTSVIPALLGYAGSMLVVDPKGENAWITAPRRRMLNEHVVILDPWNIVNEKYGSQVGITEVVTRFNPLSSLDPNHPDFADDIASVSDALIIPDKHSSPHWADSARELISGLAAAVIETDPGNGSVGDIRALVTSPSWKLLEYIRWVKREAERKGRPGSLAVRKLTRFLDPKKTGEIDSIRSTAETQTAVFDSERLKESMRSGPEGFNLSWLATKRTTVYICLPANRLHTHNRWLRLIITLAIRAISEVKREPSAPVIFLLDEMGSLGNLSTVEQAFGLMSGMSIRVWGFYQDLDQMQRDYSASWGTFISNASVLQILTARDTITSDFVSDYLGTYTYHVDERSKMARQVMNPHEVRTSIGETKQLHDCHQLVIYTGRSARLVQLAPYYCDPRWRPYYRAIPGTPPFLNLVKPNPNFRESTFIEKLRGAKIPQWVPYPADPNAAVGSALPPVPGSSSEPRPAALFAQCPECRGARRVKVSFGTASSNVECKTCKGSGGVSNETPQETLKASIFPARLVAHVSAIAVSEKAGLLSFLLESGHAFQLKPDSDGVFHLVLKYRDRALSEIDVETIMAAWEKYGKDLSDLPPSHGSNTVSATSLQSQWKKILQRRQSQQKASNQNIRQPRPCPECRGAGQVDFKMGSAVSSMTWKVTCKTCHGAGKIAA